MGTKREASGGLALFVYAMCPLRDAGSIVASG
jgi:hypothetical protein